MQRTTLLILTLAALISASAQTACTGPMHGDRDDCPDDTIYQHLVFVPERVDSLRFADRAVYFDTDDMYERMDREMLSFALKTENSVLILKRAPKYLPRMREILKEEGVPEDMVYLCVVESNLNEVSRSGVGAAGLWQFMEATAREYGLEVSETVDERYNVELATRAASKYMKAAHRRLGDWLAVAAAYNAGTGGINSKRTAQQTDDIFRLWLASETNRYVFRTLAAKILIEHPRRLGFDIRQADRYRPAETRDVVVKGSIADLAKWAVEQGTTYRELKELNRWLRGRRLDNRRGKTYVIKLPR